MSASRVIIDRDHANYYQSHLSASYIMKTQLVTVGKEFVLCHLQFMYKYLTRDRRVIKKTLCISVIIKLFTIIPVRSFAVDIIIDG